MIHRMIFAIFLFFATLPAQAQCSGPSYLDTLAPNTRAALASASAAQPYAQGLIWDGTRGDRRITLIGTLHLHDPRLAPLRDQIAADIANADLLLLEATPNDERALEQMLANDPSRFVITTGPTLPDLLDPPSWAALSSAAQDRGVPAVMAAQMQPWYLSLLLAIPPCAMAALAQGHGGLDGLISDLALANGTPMQALEPVTTLFDIFTAIPMDQQLAMLRLGLADPALQEQVFIATLDAYFAQDVALIWELSRHAALNTAGIDPAQAAVAFAQMEQALLIQRNQNWQPVIAAASADHRQIVAAFGAAHLFGETGVLQLLAKDGWDLQRRQ